MDSYKPTFEEAVEDGDFLINLGNLENADVIEIIRLIKGTIKPQIKWFGSYFDKKFLVNRPAK
jgi:hypothetical protein